MSQTRGEYWVTFDVLESEAAELEDATGAGDDRVGGVVMQEPSDGTAMVVFEMVADDSDDAWRQAEEVYEQLRALAGLENAPSLGGTVTRLRGAPPQAAPDRPASGALPPAAAPQRYDELLEKASRLLDGGEHEHATIAAQTACEVAIGEAMRRLIGAHAPKLQKAMEGFIGRQFALSQDRMVDLWQALAGEDIRQVEGGLWERYRRHVRRRSGIVHEGNAATREEAEESLELARELCAYVSRLSA